MDENTPISEETKEAVETVSETPNDAPASEETVSAEIPTNDKNAPSAGASPVFKTVFEYVEMFSVALCVVMLIFMLAFRLCTVRGASMEHTLYENEKLVVSNLFYTPKRGDVIIFHQTGHYNEPIVKRVIATGGEWVDMEFHGRGNEQKIVIRIYDERMNLIEELDESAYVYLDPTRHLEADYEFPIYVPEGYLFVLGDNRNNSADSRSITIGLVDERRVLGKVLFRVSPFDRFGSVD